MTLDANQITAIIGVILGSGVLVVVVAKFLKKVLKLKTDSVIHTMVVIIAFVASAAQYILQIHSKLPPEVLGISASAIYGVSQFVYKYAIYLNTFWSKVQAFNASQTVPASTLAPIAPAGAVFGTAGDNTAQYVTTGNTKLPPPEFSV